MDRPNFYDLLELDPAVSDAPRIEEALRRKQVEWSNLRNKPGKEHLAKKHLDLIPQIRAVMGDSTQREEEARQAVRLRKDREREAAARLDRDIALLAVQGFVLENEVAELVRRFREFSESDIRRRIRVPIRREAAAAPAARPTLDNAIRKPIEDNLAILEKPDLYAFLGLSRTASLTALLNRSRELNAQALANNNKTAEVGAQQVLSGFGLSLFKTEAERQKYDNTLDQQGLRELEPQIDLAGLGGRITAQRMEQLLRLAREKGVGLDEARAYIVAHAAKKKWSVEVATEVQAAKLQRCVCGVLSPEQATACGACGEPLRVECPRCRTVNPSENRACSSCGFSVGDAALVRRRLREADLALARNDTPEAVRLLEESLVYWPGYAEAERRLAALRQRQAEQERAFQPLARAVAERRFREAERLLAPLRAAHPTRPGLPELHTQIAAALGRARQHLARGQQLERAGKGDDALDAFAEALRECQDLDEARDALARCPPAPAQRLEARVTASGVALHWQASPSRRPVRYHVRRRAGSAPTTPQDGEAVAETAATTAVDEAAPVGLPACYAVFTERDGVFHPSAATTGPVLRVADVQALRAVARDGSVHLEWQPPPRAAGIEVWRKAGSEPARRGDGTRVAAVTATSALDTGLHNGQLFGYRVVALFTGPEGSTHAAAGVTTTAMPEQLPSALTTLQAAREGNAVVVRWTPPARGQVQVYRLQTPPRWQVGDVVAVSELSALGRPLASAGPGVARDVLGSQLDVRLLPVTVAGSSAVVGKPLHVTWIDDVEGLSAQARDGTLWARWTWPAGVEVALVAYRSDRYPTGPGDRTARRAQCLKTRYEIDGGFRCPLPQVERIFLAVYAAVPHGSKWRFAPAAGPGARVEVAVDRQRRVQYRVRARSRLPFGLGRNGEHELVLTPDRPTTLPALVLVGKPDGTPLTPDDGAILLQVPANSACAPDQPLVLQFRGRGEAVRLFPRDEAECAWLDLVGP